MSNPYQPPEIHSIVDVATRPKSRLFNIWVFVMVWAFVCVGVTRFGLPYYWNKPRWVQTIFWLPFVLGHVIYIAAAIRYPTTVPKRILRGLASAVVFGVFVQFARVLYDWIFSVWFGL